MSDLQDYSFNSSSKPAQKLVIFLHGYGADGKDLISIAPMWAEGLPNTVFYAPNAPERCEMSPTGFQWFGLSDRSETAMNLGAQTAKRGLEAYIQQKIETHNLSMSDVAIVGFSQGTMMALYTMPQLSEGACAGVLGYSGRLVGLDDIKANLNAKFPICAIHGTADEVVPFESLAIIDKELSPLGFDIKTYESAGLGHGIDEKGLKTGYKFLKDCLK